MKNKTHIWTKFGAMMIIILVTSCFPEEADNNGLTEESLDATFTITPIEGSSNRFILKANTTDYIMSKWELGDGSPAFMGNEVEEIFLPDKGDYTVIHTAVGKGGFQESESLPLNIPVPDPVSGNIVRGGKLDTQEDIDEWTILNISASGASWSFNGGKATVTGGGWNQQGFYQEINVIEGKKYKIDMVGSSTTGVSNTWFEVYCSTTAPVQNNDYGGDILRNINTWDGCGTSAFSGKISSIGCNKDKNAGTFTASATGIMYLVIKCGGENLSGGISVDNIEVRGTSD
ncbi:MAG: hypothetical protein ABI663_04765 [Chryseolinea sp.]